MLYNFLINNFINYIILSTIRKYKFDNFELIVIFLQFFIN